MKLAESDVDEIFTIISELLEEQGYSKVFAKVNSSFEKFFVAQGYTEEARIPGFYNGLEDAVFMCRYVSADREYVPEETADKIKQVLKTAKAKKAVIDKPAFSGDYSIGKLTESDAEQLAVLYRKVFESYPFPIHDPEYLRKTMTENFIYYGVFCGDKLLAASSAEMDIDSKNVEMTDFATEPDFTGNGFALSLLYIMQEQMQEKGMKTFYTIARALSWGMNITFAKAGYNYSGTLINNTNISGQIESMNIWYKSAC
jgi:putative beta-lysine N-acetyltransferase